MYLNKNVSEKHLMTVLDAFMQQFIIIAQKDSRGAQNLRLSHNNHLIHASGCFL